ncbi:hypothetical protein COLSTE_00035 [Collinsella stercoris DSM 13279]|uniref:Uncharacterized protein n=1 Tax=Collinsella stercoris DSM 13279 TaxID=445975 RepID=B6G7J7_9ACTN|nr:hypothetical protein COLSTE_00035 [Collinsella stercoris DSM 13279]
MLAFFLRHGRRFGHSLVVQGTVRSVFCGVCGCLSKRFPRRSGHFCCANSQMRG